MHVDLSSLEDREVAVLVVAAAGAALLLARREIVQAVPRWPLLASAFGLRLASYFLTVVESFFALSLGAALDAAEHLTSAGHSLLLVGWVLLVLKDTREART